MVYFLTVLLNVVLNMAYYDHTSGIPKLIYLDGFNS